MINFCTLFDTNYLTRGLALNESLGRVCPSYHLYVVTFDDNSYDYLKKAAFPSVTPISLKEFEDEQLLAIKPTRSAGEYCWTCTPSVILYCIEKFNLPSCTYIDADMIFYSDPQVLLDEMGTRSVLISEHRFTKDYEKAGVISGIYCVQFMCFRNDADGITVLRWWRERCLEWCYARLEDGKFGDQKYLDDWTQRFRGVHVLEHPGGGVAPWNLQQYTFEKEGEKIFIRTSKGERYPLVFFHFHGLKFYADEMATCSGAFYYIDGNTKRIIYIPYLRKLMQLSSRLRKEGVPINDNGGKVPAPGKWRVFAVYMWEIVTLALAGNFSLFRAKNYNFSRHYHFYHLDQL